MAPVPLELWSPRLRRFLKQLHNTLGTSIGSLIPPSTMAIVMYHGRPIIKNGLIPLKPDTVPPSWSKADAMANDIKFPDGLSFGQLGV